jgi:hypothetical protein
VAVLLVGAALCGVASAASESQLHTNYDSFLGGKQAKMPPVPTNPY